MSDDVRDHLVFFVNGKRQVVKDAQPEVTLLSWLRASGLTGTKLGCGEGGCGACTVMVSSYDHGAKTIRHAAVNACLAPICSVDTCHVTTVEGVGTLRKGLHPVQQRIAALHGSQCGFCTPGIVMALYALLRSKPTATVADIEESMDGNLCRCTGYRPILDAAKSLASDARAPQGCCRGSAGGGCPCMAAKAGDDEETIKECTTTRVNDPRYSVAYSDSAEPIFPPALMLSPPPALAIEGVKVAWHAPTTMAALLLLKAKHPESKLVVGNTEVGIETKFKNLLYPVIIAPTRVPEMVQVVEAGDGSGIVIGGAATLATMEHFFNTQIQSKPAHTTRGLMACTQMLRWFASNQIRNVAALAGNLATASPISDMNPMLSSLGATLTLASESGRREVKVADFFLGYRKVDMRPEEIIASIHVPYTKEFEFVGAYKQARRREDDISIVTCGMRLNLQPSADGWLVAGADLVFGGMAPTTVTAKKTNAYLQGKLWCEETLDGAFTTLAEDMPLPKEVPGGQSEFRQALPPSFLFKFFVQTSIDLDSLVAQEENAGRGLPAAPVVDAATRSAARTFVNEPKPPSSGRQEYTLEQGGMQLARPVPHVPDNEAAVRAPVGQPIMHKSAPQQVTGEAVYTDDIPAPAGTLQAALVLSTRPHAKLLSVNASAALEIPGVVDYICAKHVTGDNNIGPVVKDEECFATDEVHCVGQVIGIVLAETEALAQEAAKMVKVEYEDLPAIITIEDAIAAKSFFAEDHVILDGNPDDALRACDVVVEGEMRIGGQEHFYLETNATLAVPGENGAMEIFASTQNPTKTQTFAAHVCGVPANNVVCRMKRMGGGFGGKETRSVFISCAAALAAHVTGRPVNIMLDRDVDMQTTGQRHAFTAKYKAGASKEGKLEALIVDIYNNAGCSLDLSASVMDRALFHLDGVYKWSHVRVRGHVARTNQPSHTAYRGFGAPQGMMVVETIVDRLAAQLKISPTTMREKNMYLEGDRTHYGQLIERWNVPAAWEDMKRTAEIERRQKEISQFNAANRYRKRGLYLMPTKFGISFTVKFMNQGGALVHVYTDGTVLVSHGGTEMGQGLHTKVIQTCARAFGISDEWVHVAETATDRVPNASPTAASMSTDLYCMAALDACEQIKERLKPVAEKLPGADFKTIVQAGFFQRVNLSAQGFYVVPSDRCGYDFNVPGDDNRARGQPFNYYTQGVAASEVEVDTLTGDARVLRADITMDVGNSINPAIDIGQIEGAFVQGYGWCTMEELIWGDADHKWVRPGQLFTKGPGAYKIPSFNDVPGDMRVKLMHSVNNPFAVHSSKAIGEPPFFLASSAFFAIKAAIRAAREDHGIDATTHFDLYSPASSERIRMAIPDKIVVRVAGGETGDAAVASTYQPKGSW
ncbi:putative xanthine dehydrogenase [Tribonema minus]|uniref:xanthine dehydrogenase n=1 Tax=Tribonema minus TaxID=303371 RepID=A0A836C8N1_9STRA|nr:putative xanthine dehydrogenase [Tribonema minus]